LASILANAGRAILTNRLKGAGTEPLFVAWGIGAGTAQPTDTALSSESGEARVAGTSSIVTTTVTNDTYQVVGTLTASGPRTITNCGLFDAETAGNLFVKSDFPGLALNAGDSIQLTQKLQFA
jgi:hypothetical protein